MKLEGFTRGLYFLPVVAIRVGSYFLEDADGNLIEDCGKGLKLTEDSYAVNSDIRNYVKRK